MLALFGAGIVEVAADAAGHGQVGLFDVAEHLLVKRSLKILGRLHQVVGVCVFVFEILDDFRVLLFAKPEVIVF